MDEGLGVLFRRISLLKDNIIKFSNLQPFLANAAMTPKTVSVDSLFIVDSLVYDLEDLMNREDAYRDWAPRYQKKYDIGALKVAEDVSAQLSFQVTTRYTKKATANYCQFNIRELLLASMFALFVGSLVNLEYLLVKSHIEIVISIRSVILEMVKLRYLRITNAGFHEECNSSQINNLEFLSNVIIDNLKDEEMLKCSPNLRKLKCECHPFCQTDSSKGNKQTLEPTNSNDNIEDEESDIWIGVEESEGDGVGDNERDGAVVEDEVDGVKESERVKEGDKDRVEESRGYRVKETNEVG
ncbi:hypothetical protein Pfo_008303 [Paulownia fortunei]|nr:hypothetical protein Pfo_008303 [Paulownia fortunei]